MKAELPNFNTNVKVVKHLLKQHRDGLTAAQIGEMTGWSYRTVTDACIRVKGIYVDRWTVNERGNAWVRVYCLGNELDAPKPEAAIRRYRHAPFSGLGSRA